MKNMKILFLMVLFLLSILSTSNVAYGDSVPDWVKNTAGWWATDSISEKEFLNAIEYLIKDDVIPVDASNSSENSRIVPDWVKNTAGWWATDSISEKEFLNAIEYLIKLGIINIKNSLCDKNEDTNRNGIPDELENIKNIQNFTNFEFRNQNWNNCLFIGDLSHIGIFNSDLRNADFSNAVLVDAYFKSSNLTSADFSNATLHGASFLRADLINVNFDNADFSPDNWDRPFFTFTYTEEDTNFSCYLKECNVQMTVMPSLDDPMHASTFGKYNFPISLRFTDSILDESDIRTIWRHVAGFAHSKIENSTFNNADLSHANFFFSNNISNVDFSHANVSGMMVYDADFRNVILNDEYFEDDYIDLKLIPKKISDVVYEIETKKFSNTSIYSDIKFNNALDDIPINWSMGMLIHDQKFYVADTDNHRIIIYDGNTLKKLDSFTSPIQNFCDGVNAFTQERADCPNNLRNLPTSLAIIDEKIFVAYVFQNMIQVFDMNNFEFLHSFGESGNKPGKFIEAYHIYASEDELFVSDAGNHRIQVFDAEGNFLRQFSTDVADIINSRPIDLAITDKRIYVAESSTSSILIFDMDGNFLKKIVLDDIEANSISGIDVYDEIIFVVDSDNNRILIFDIDGNKIMHFGNSGDRYGEFNNPKDVVSDGKRIFVSDTYNYRIQIFDLIP